VINVNRPPSAFSLISPEIGDTVETNTFLLVWHSSSDPDGGDSITYRVLLDTLAHPSTIIDSSSSDTTYQITNLVAQRRYYWTIIAFDRDSAYTWASDTAYFFLNPPNSILENGTLPTVYSIEQNYPNPFNSLTTIKFDLPKQSYVDVEIYDILGRIVGSPLHQEMPAGHHQIIWNSGGSPSGVYFYRIQAGEFTQTRKMMLLK
jgi:hypothetical protein